MSASIADYIAREIRGNNVLGLPEDEIAGMVAEIISSEGEAQVHDWCNTLGLGTPVAEQIVRMRSANPAAAAAAASAAAAAANPSAQQQEAAAASKVAQGGRTLDARSGKKKKNKHANNRGTKVDVNKKTAPHLKLGLHECGCFATVHKLKGNCANCGRIICEQESDELCYFCGLDPSRCIAYEISVQEGKLSEAALHADAVQYEAAIARRDTLLEYANNRAKRTKVIDDQSASLFAPQDAWITPAQRQQAQKDAAAEEQRRQIEALHRQRGSYGLHSEFVKQNLPLGSLKRDGEAGGEVGPREGDSDGDDHQDGSSSSADGDVAPVVLPAEPLPSLVRNIWYSPDGSHVDEGGKGKKEGKGAGNQKTNQTPGQLGDLQMHKAHAVPRFEQVSKRVQQDYFNDDVTLFVTKCEEKALHFDPALLLLSSAEHGDDDDDDGTASTVVSGSNAGDVAATVEFMSAAPHADQRFLPSARMLAVDEGVCLSMHQPWASLLVEGIKRHEGRTWYSEYRGRLWIHAAAAPPTNVAEVEAHYEPFKAPLQPFPQHYPTRVLLGYVYVTAVLSLEEYEKTFKPEERQEASPFSFICAQPKKLLFPLPMVGDHKLFKLDRKVLVAAKKQLGEMD